MFPRTTLLAAAFLVSLLATVGPANANMVAALNGIANSASQAGAFDFTYSATLGADDQISAGSSIVLYDWGSALGRLPTSATGTIQTSFNFSQQLAGPTPRFQGPPDSSTVLNVVATYGGNTVSGSELGNGAAGNLGTFVLTSLAPGIGAQGMQMSPAQSFTPSDIVGVRVFAMAEPTFPAGAGAATPNRAFPVPEPATLALLGLPLAFAAARRRRRKA